MALGLNEFKKRFGKKPVDEVSPEDRFKERFKQLGPKLVVGRNRGDAEARDASVAITQCIGKKDWHGAADILEEMAPKVAVDPKRAATLRRGLKDCADRAVGDKGLPEALRAAHDAVEAAITADQYDMADDALNDFDDLVDDYVDDVEMWAGRIQELDGKFDQVQLRTRVSGAEPSAEEKGLDARRSTLRTAVQADRFATAAHIWTEAGQILDSLLAEPEDKSAAALKKLYEDRLAAAKKDLKYWLPLAELPDALLASHQAALGALKLDADAATTSFNEADYQKALTSLDAAVAQFPGLRSAVKAQDIGLGASIGKASLQIAKAIRDKKLPASVPGDLNIKALNDARIARVEAQNAGDYVKAIRLFKQYEGGFQIIWREMEIERQAAQAQPKVSPKTAEYQQLISAPDRAALTKALNARDADLAAFRAQPGAAKLLDDMVGAIGGKADTQDKRDFVQAAMKARFDLTDISGGADGKGMSTKALPRMYQIFKDLPSEHTTDNKFIASVERQKAHDTSWHSPSQNKIVLKAGKTGKVGGDFDETTLHEIAHGVDLKFNFMGSNGKSRSFGGWQKESKESVFKVAADELGFYKHFEAKDVAPDVLAKYLERVFAGANPETLKDQFEAANDPETISANALTNHPAVKHAAEGQAKTKGDTDAQRDLMFAAQKLIKDKEPKKGMISHIVEAVAYGKKPADAVKALLDTLTCRGHFPDDAIWQEMAVHPAIDFAANVGLKNGSSGLWDQGDAGAKRCAVNGRVYQQAYANDWVSYLVSARETKVSDYQFRHWMEWFAECYARYFVKKLPASHSLVPWLQKQTEAANKAN